MNNDWLVLGALALGAAALVFNWWRNNGGRNHSTPKKASDDCFVKYQLVRKSPITHNVCRLRFALDSETDSLDLPPGKHILVRMPAPGGTFKRKPYTPISHRNQHGFFDLLVKRYETGNVSRYLHDLSPGDFAEFKTPHGQFEYVSNVHVNLGMVAGGSGITPMVQIIREVLEVQEGHDRTRLSLVYANSTPNDVLCRERLEELCRRFPEQLNVHLTVSRFANDAERQKWYTLAAKAPRNFSIGEGRIAAAVFREHLAPATPEGASGSFVLTCGPAGFSIACRDALLEIGYSAKQIRKL